MNLLSFCFMNRELSRDVLILVVSVLVTMATVTVDSQFSAEGMTALRSKLESVAALPGQPSVVSAAGITRSEVPLLTIENVSAYDVTSSKLRLVLVGGLDGNPDSAHLALDAVSWFKRDASHRDRERWEVSVLPVANPSANEMSDATFPPEEGFFDHPDRPEDRYVWRWVSYQVPDLVVEVVAGTELRVLSSSVGSGTGQLAALSGGSLSEALAEVRANGLGSVDTMLITAPVSSGGSVMREVLQRASGRRSQLRATITERLKREPLTLARLLAQRYPTTPGMNYIPALAWVHTLRLGTLTGDSSFVRKVEREIRPWLNGEQRLFSDPIRLNSVAGTMVFGELAKLVGESQAIASELSVDGVARASAEITPGIPQYGFGWSDDIFLGTIAATTTADASGLDAAVRLITNYARRLQRSDGLFDHSIDAKTAWGRGNGFAALGLAETLSVLPVNHMGRSSILDIYRRHMHAIRIHQAADGMWQQVVDEPGSYRETSATAAIVTAMARGLRNGWLDTSFRSVVERGWNALLAHVVDDGTLVDVCISTGAGSTKRHYLDRRVVNGADDRGGAMVLGAALEIYALNQVS